MKVLVAIDGIEVKIECEEIGILFGSGDDKTEQKGFVELKLAEATETALKVYEATRKD